MSATTATAPRPLSQVEVTPIKKLSIFTRFKRVITQIWKAFLRVICFWKQRPKPLTDRQIQLMQAIKRRSEKPVITAVTKQQHIKDAYVEQPKPDTSKVKQAEEPVTPTFRDESIQKGRDFTKGFVEEVVGVVFDEHLEEKAKLAQQKIGEINRQNIKETIKQGIKAGKIIDDISGNFISDKLKKSKLATEEITVIIRWLLADKSPGEDLKKGLESDLVTANKPEIEAKERVIWWLFNNGFKLNQEDVISGKSVEKQQPVDEKLFQKFFYDAFAFLVASKVDAILTPLKADVFNDGFTGWFKDIMTKNAGRVTDILTARLGDLLVELSWDGDNSKGLFEQMAASLIEKTQAHVRGYLSASDAVATGNYDVIIRNGETYTTLPYKEACMMKETLEGNLSLHQEKLKRVEAKLKSNPEDQKLQALKSELKTQISSVTRELSSLTKTLEEAKQEATYKAFAPEQPTVPEIPTSPQLKVYHKAQACFDASTKWCHPMTRNAVNLSVPEEKRNKMGNYYEENLAKAQQHLEKEAFNAIAKDIFDLLLPQIGGKDPLLELWEKRSTDDNLEKLIKTVEHLLDGTIPPSVRQLIVQLVKKETDIDLSEKAGPAIMKFIRGRVESGIMLGLTALAEEFIRPKQLKRIVAEDLLPQVEREMFSSLVAITFDSYHTEFYNGLLVMLTNPKKREEQLTLHATKLAEYVESSIQNADDYKGTERRKDRETAARATLEHIEKSIKPLLEGKKITRELVRGAVKTFLAPPNKEPVKDDHHLGKTVLDIVYRVGELNQKEWIARKFEGKISQQLNTILKTFTESHHKSLSLAVDEARDQFMTRDKKGNKVVDTEKVKQLLEPKKPITPDQMKAQEEATQKRFDLGVHKVGLLARDTLYRAICKPATNVFKKGVNGAVASNLPTAAEIERVIHNVYRKMFGDPLFNTNLTLNVVDIVRGHFKEAAQRVHATRTTSPPTKVEVVA